MFNPEARWDRRLPAREGAYPEEKISVTATFSKGKIIPRAFAAPQYRYEITRINYEWRERSGRDLVYYFSVSVGEETYCLCLSTEKMSWRLKRLG